MAEYLDFFNIYVLSDVEMAFQFYFLAKILKKKVWPLFYFLFAVCAVTVNDFVLAPAIIDFMAVAFLLTAYGLFVCHADFKSSLLYAALTTEIMLLCYGIVKSLLMVLSPFLPVVFHDMDGIGIAVMLASEAASLALAGFCYSMVYRYFSCYTAAEMQQIFLVFIPILMIFIMGEYINATEFQYVVLVDEGPSKYLFSHWQLFAMHLLGLLSLFCILFSYKKLQQNFRLSTELSLLEQEEHSLNQYVEEAKARYNETKSFRHEYRNAWECICSPCAADHSTASRMHPTANGLARCFLQPKIEKGSCP